MISPLQNQGMVTDLATHTLPIDKEIQPYCVTVENLSREFSYCTVYAKSRDEAIEVARERYPNQHRYFV